MLAAVRARVLTLLVVLLAAGCGGGSGGNGMAKKTSEAVVAAALQAAKHARLVHVVGSGEDNGTPLKIDLWIAAKQGTGHLQEQGTTFDIVRVGDDVYVRGDDEFRRQLGAAAGVTLPKGTWVKGSTTNPVFASLAPLLDIGNFFDNVLGRHGKLVNKGETSRDGQKAVEIRDTSDGSSLFVAAEGDPYPLALAPKGGSGTLSFEEWNGEQAIAAPDDSVDFSTLAKP
jgi:hypothetical protein